MKSLKKRTSSALIWDLGGTFVKQSINFIITIFLARLLLPEEFGLIGMAMVLIAMVEVFIDAGFSAALIQNKSNSDLTYSSVFYINIVLGLVLTLIFFFLAPYIGRFYDNHEVVEVIKWLSLIFIFNSGNLVQMAILKRELNFKIINIRITIAAGIGGGAGVIAAFSGLGVYSLIIQNVLTAIIGTILLWSISNWKPSFTFSFKEVKKLFSFSSYMLLDRITSAVLKRFDVIIIAKIFNASILGFYTRAFTLKDLVTKYSSNTLNKVFFPVLSEIQNEQDKFSKVYISLLSVIAFISFGLSGILFLMGRDIILMLFGDKWEYSIFIFQMLNLAFLTYPFEAQVVNAFLSKGKAKENFYIGLIRKFGRLIPFYFAYKYGLYMYLYLIIGVNLFLAVVSIFLMSKYVQINPYKHFRKLFECSIPLIISVSIYFIYDFDSLSFLHRLALVTLFIIMYLVYSVIIKNEGYKIIVKELSLIKKRIV